MTTCPVCGNQVPAGEYCGACGADLVSGSARRMDAFAAEPSQHVLQPNVISTLFPHLPHRHSTPFRLGLLLAALLLVVLGVARLTGPAIAVAAAAVPLLYLLYLYEVEVHEREPALVIALTFGLGALLGIPWGIVTGPIVTHALLHDITAGVAIQNVLVAGIVLPLAAQLLMLVGPVVLYLRGHHREPVDGFTFGASSALGFTLATTLVNLGPELRGGLVAGAPALSNALMVLSRGLLIPFLVASTTGLVAGAIWMRRRAGRELPASWITTVPAAAVVAAVVDGVLGVSGVTISRLGVVVAIYLVVAAALLLWVRLALHAMLLAEVGSPQPGPAFPCSNCHRVVPHMTFCPHCGVATAATPRRRQEEGLPSSPGAETASAPYRAASREELRVWRTRAPRRAWSAVAGAVVAGAVILGAVAILIAPSRRAACRLLCVPPPPPCVNLCKQASPAPPMKTSQSYTSAAYGYSVDYTDFDPSHEDSSSIEWDLGTDVGQYTVEEVGTHADGRSAQGLLNDVVANNFQDYSQLYDVPGAEIGYASGAGAVYDDEVTPLFGVASDTRLVVMTAVKQNLAIVLVGDGDAASNQGGQPDPSGLPVSAFVDSLADATLWPGGSPR